MVVAMHSKLDVLRSAVGQRIRSARRSRDISQEDLAATVGRSTAALSNIERGASLPPLDTLFQIAEALDVPISAFFANIDTSASPKRVELDAEMAMQLRALRDDQMATALRVVKALREP